MEKPEGAVPPKITKAALAAGAALFAGACLLWIYCLPPGLAAYRDAGEMACDVFTLGVAHQPGYPLYILAAKLASFVLPGSFAYKLNLFSAACGLAALVTLYFTLASRFGAFPAFAAAAVFSLNFTLQTVSGVSEMYSLNLFFAGLLLAAALSFEEGWSRRKVWLSAYLLGLAMTNRMDIVLAAPALLLAALPGFRERGAADVWRAAAGAALFWLAGFSLYLYLPVRSGSFPLFDWSHPASAGAFLAVLTRKSYGSTLDLISQNYAAGELFLPNMKYYALHLAANFNFILAASAAGLFAEFKSDRRRFWTVAALFAVSGPLFLFTANMPPNPHSLAIVEPYYLLPDLAVVFWAAAGLRFLAERARAPLPVLAAAGLLCFGLAARHNLPVSCRRTVFAAEDWGRDVLKSVPPSAVLVGKKDVQLFTLWYLQTVRGERPDVKLVSQGLSSAAWYQDTMSRREPGLRLCNLNTGGAAEWERFIRSNPGGVYATFDSELPDGFPARPRGLVNVLGPDGAPDPWASYNFRWFGEPGDFFAKDLASSYAGALVARAVWDNGHGGVTREDAELLKAARLIDPDIWEAPLYLGFHYSSIGDWREAARYFRASAEVNERMLALAEEYRSLPPLKKSIATWGAYAWLNYGVALEKTGDRPGAQEAYERALRADPGLAEAHYNMAILFWDRDPRRVYYELSETLRLNPGHRQAAYYLSRMRAKKGE